MEYLNTVRQINFTKLWLSQILSQVAANLLNFALIILVYNLTLGSRFASFSVSLLVLSFAIPSIFAAPAAGAYVDFWDRKKILVTTNLLRTILVLLYIPAQNNLILILLLTFVIATVTQFFLPAEAATIPKLVPKKHLLTANSLFVFSMYAAFLVGFSASGPAVQLFGREGAYYVTAAMFAVATILTTLIPPQPVVRKKAKLPRIHLIQQLQENWRIITSHPDRYFALVQMGITQGIVFVLITLAPALSEALLKIPLEQASHVLIIPVGIGMVLGVLMVGTVAKQRGKRAAIEVCMALSGAGLMALGLSALITGKAAIASIGLIVGSIMLVLGIMNAMMSALAQTILQETTDDEQRGKVFGSLQMLINIASTLPVFVAGILADLIKVTTVVVLIGAMLTVYALWMLWRSSSFRASKGVQ